MHVKIRNKTAVIEFENNADTAGHDEVMKEMIELIGNGFKKFVFDFKWVDISFNSAVSGFLVVVTKKIVESGAVVIMSNIRDIDKDLLKVVGIDGDKIIYE